MQNETSYQVAYGGFFVRLGAFLVDYIIIQAALMIIRLPLWFSGMLMGGSILSGDLIFDYSLANIIIYLAYKAYFVICTYSSGTTLGKRLFRLQVVSKDGSELSFFDVLYRETIGKYLSGLIIGIGYIMIGLTPTKEAFHDYLCDTRVVYK